MNIVHITTSLIDGGAQAVLYRLCTHDKQNRHTVISLMDSGKYGAMLEASGIAVHCLYMPRGRITLTGLWRLWRLLRSERPDVVQTWMYHADFIGGIVARLARIRIVCWGIHNSNLEPGKIRTINHPCSTSLCLVILLDTECHCQLLGSCGIGPPSIGLCQGKVHDYSKWL